MPKTEHKEMDFSNTSIIELAGIVANHLQQHDIEVVLVGGLAVEIYSENIYLTKDIDMVNTNYTKPSNLNRAMGELGFIKQGRVYINKTTKISVEFPPAPLSVGDELITNTTTTRTANGDLPILHVDDVIKDRLAAYIHWQDNQSLIQAIAVMQKHQLMPDNFSDFYRREGTEQQSQLIETLHKAAVENGAQTMLQLETILAEIIIKQL